MPNVVVAVAFCALVMAPLSLCVMRRAWGAKSFVEQTTAVATARTIELAMVMRGNEQARKALHAQLEKLGAL